MSSVHQYPKSGPYWASNLPYHGNNRMGGYFQTEQDNWEKWKSTFDVKARNETRALLGDIFFICLLTTTWTAVYYP